MEQGLQRNLQYVVAITLLALEPWNNKNWISGIPNTLVSCIQVTRSLVIPKSTNDTSIGISKLTGCTELVYFPLYHCTYTAFC